MLGGDSFVRCKGVRCKINSVTVAEVSAVSAEAELLTHHPVGPGEEHAQGECAQNGSSYDSEDAQGGLKRNID